MINKTQAKRWIPLIGIISVALLVNSRYLYNEVVSIYYEKIVSPYYKATAEQKRRDKEGNSKSVVVINTGSTYYCGQAGVAKTRSYLDNLLADGWSIESSDTSTFASTQYGYNRGKTCSFTYYVVKR